MWGGDGERWPMRNGRRVRTELSARVSSLGGEAGGIGGKRWKRFGFSWWTRSAANSAVRRSLRGVEGREGQARALGMVEAKESGALRPRLEDSARQ